MRALFVILFLAAAHAHAQPAEPWQEYVTLARTAAPEFTADALIRIAASALTPKAKRIPLLNEAFETAAIAAWKIRLFPAINNLHVDSREGKLDDAMSLNLDALSLQARVVRALLPLDAPGARDYFTRIPPPRIPAYSCKDPLVANPAIYYEVAGELVKSAFTEPELARREPVRFIETLARTATSIVQLEPIAELILAASTDSEGFANLVSAFASALGSVDVSDRAFRLPFGLNQRIFEIVTQCRKREIPVEALVQAWRATLVRHFSGTRCADNYTRGQVANARAAQADPLARIFDFPEAAPLSDEEMKPLKVLDEIPEQHDYWKTAPAKNITASLARLRESPDRNAGSLTLLQELDAWKPGSEASPTDHFQQISLAYAELLPIVPGAVRDRVVTRVVAFLLASSLQRESPVEWFQAASTLARRAGPAADRLWAEYAASGHPILVLHARLNHLR